MCVNESLYCRAEIYTTLNQLYFNSKINFKKSDKKPQPEFTIKHAIAHWAPCGKLPTCPECHFPACETARPEPDHFRWSLCEAIPALPLTLHCSSTHAATLRIGLHHGMARVDVACGVLRSSFHLKKNLMAGFAARFPCLSLQLVFCRHHLVWEMHSGHSTFLISHFRGVSPWE